MHRFLTLAFFTLCIGLSLSVNLDHGKTPRATTDDIHFYLWTQSNSGNNNYDELINGDSSNLQSSNFDSSRNTYFITHGYTDNGLTSFILNAKTKILSVEDANVISIDWQKLAISADYWIAADNVYVVGPYAATFIDFLNSETGLKTSKIQMAGHSLGAHVIGMTAQAVTSGQIDRLTGLDPAGPNFYDASSTERLDKSQANYVDIIHTNGGSLAQTDYGMIKSIGDADFFPNGGSKQPGCNLAADTAGCSHGRSHDYWVESITAGPDYSSGSGSTNLIFQAWPCSDWDTFDAGSCTSCGSGCVNMGFHNNNGPSGSFYLRTYDTSPFAYGIAQ